MTTHNRIYLLELKIFLCLLIAVTIIVILERTILEETLARNKLKNTNKQQRVKSENNEDQNITAKQLKDGKSLVEENEKRRPGQTDNVTFSSTVVADILQGFTSTSKPYEGIQVKKPPIILYWYTAYLQSIPKSPVCGGGCILTGDRNMLEDADAVVFLMKFLNKADFPTRSNRNQVFVYLCREATNLTFWHHKLTLLEYDNLFNWTMTYRRDSDVNAMQMPFRAYGFVEQLYKSRIANNDPLATNFTWLKYSKDTATCTKNTMNSNDIDKILSEKKFLGAWVAGNCGTTSDSARRFAMVQSLKRMNVSINIFGKCASEQQTLTNEYVAGTLRHYKFYMTFENHYHCHDYISEKVWYNAFYVGVVPVIWGPTKDDAAAVLPRGSYIHAEDFSSLKDLAKYLRYLDKNMTMYKKYFDWRINNPCAFPLYKVDGEDDIHGEDTYPYHYLNNGYCQLCRMLNDGYHLKTSTTINSLAKRWYGKENEECFNFNAAMMKLQSKN